MLFVLGLILLAAAATAGYLYWDYAKHFKSTDDAFIASRQFAVAPKVSGYITAVPVTDNQHVSAGDVIAQIDQRDYRIALEQARAQVDAAKASIAEHRRPNRRPAGASHANQAQVEQAQADAGVRAAAGGALRGPGQQGSGSGAECAAVQLRTLHQQEAALKSAQAAVDAAQRQVESPQGAARQRRVRASRRPRPSATRRN